jgi:CHRD domain-containing protein
MKKLPLLLGAFALLLFAHGQVAAKGAKMTYRATLRGTEEVPTHPTTARGTATFTVSKDMSEIRYRLTVTNMKNVTEAHIHLGAPGENGPPVVMLYGPTSPGGGKKSGLLSSGSIRPSDLTGPLQGKTLQDLIAEMNANHTYVNVHSNDGVGESNTGPGDFPDGEIRGQIK